MINCESCATAAPRGFREDRSCVARQAELCCASGSVGAVWRISARISARKAKPNLASCFEGGDKRRARARHRTHGSTSTCGGRTPTRRACLSRTSHGHARGLLSFSLPSRQYTQTHSIRSSPRAGCSRTHAHLTSDARWTSRIRHSDTAPRTHRPFSFAYRTSTSSIRVLATPSHSSTVVWLCTTQAVSSPRHCSTRLTADARLTKTFVSTVSLSSPSGVSWSSLWLAGGRGGNRIRRIHGRELQQRVQLGLRGRTLCLSGDAPWGHGGRGPSTAARKHRHRP